MRPLRLPDDALESALLPGRWRFGTVSVRTVHEPLGMPQGLVYCTIARVVDRLREHVGHGAAVHLGMMDGMPLFIPCWR
ncbi:MAG: hypothetical protein M0037_03250 [Betaproteobacteria bacterium]|nr:hypothetical protein [Betaproteobacteria bacterium]